MLSFLMGSPELAPADRQSISAQIREDFERSSHLRQIEQRSRPRLRLALRSFQRQRLARTHRQELDGYCHQAARFLLDDLYPLDAPRWRDSQTLSALSSLCSLLPAQALLALSHAARLDRITEELDSSFCDQWASVSEELPEDVHDPLFLSLTPALHTELLLRGNLSFRLAQIEALREAGLALCGFASNPLIGVTLASMRPAAFMAGLSDLHSFLDRGRSAFMNLQDPQGFVERVVERERAWLASQSSPLA